MASASLSRSAKWKVENGYIESPQGLDSIRTTNKFADFQLHLEFAEPAEVAGQGQGRGNSGVLINEMYEVRILDSYNNPTHPDGQAGALYGQMPPLVNACKQPGEWQSYDILFESPRWDESGRLVKKASVTVIQNVVVLHHKHEFFGTTDGIDGVPHKSLGLTPKYIGRRSSLNCRITETPCDFATSGSGRWANMMARECNAHPGNKFT